MKHSIYLDYASTTPVCRPALEAIYQCLGPQSEFGNPHSHSHDYGYAAAAIIAESSQAFSQIIGADTKEIIWTSGATEANNLAIQGAARFYAPKGKHLVTTQIEHKSVLDVFRYLESEGFEVTYLPVQKRGCVDLKVLEASLRRDTILVSVMTVNNELGTLQPISEIIRIVKANGSLFHTDAAQALGKTPFDARTSGVDFAAFSGHKVYGPKGVGALYIRNNPRARLKPLFYGGGQQGNLRPGTLSPALISGFAKGAAFACGALEANRDRIIVLRDQFLSGLKNISCLKLNTDLGYAVPHILNLHFQGTDGGQLLTALKAELSVSQGSACTSASIQASHVLRAIGLKSIEADRSFRFSFGAYTTSAEVEAAAKIIRTVFKN